MSCALSSDERTGHRTSGLLVGGASCLRKKASVLNSQKENLRIKPNVNSKEGPRGSKLYTRAKTDSHPLSKSYCSSAWEEVVGPALTDSTCRGQ